MYCDLCLTPNSDNQNSKNLASLPNEFLDLLTSAISDSYSILAINQTRKGIVSPDKNNANPIDFSDKEILKTILTKNAIKFLNTENTNLINLDKISLLNRITIEIEDQKEMYQFSANSNNQILKNFDIVAIKPLNDGILESCLSGEVCCDMIVLDMDLKFNFFAKKHLIQSSIDKNVFFEIEYSNFVTNNESRGGFIANFLAFFDMSKGKNIVISSGASNFFSHRSPFDITTILDSIFGVKHDISKKMISENSQMVVLKSKQRKFFKTVIKSYKTNK